PRLSAEYKSQGAMHRTGARRNVRLRLIQANQPVGPSSTNHRGSTIDGRFLVFRPERSTGHRPEDRSGPTTPKPIDPRLLRSITPKRARTPLAASVDPTEARKLSEPVKCAMGLDQLGTTVMVRREDRPDDTKGPRILLPSVRTVHDR